MAITVNKLESIVINELQNENLAIFAGAGLSRASGYVDWKTLLADIAEELGLKIDEETDLVSVAQYYYNDHGRQRINEEILEQFDKEAEPNENLEILAKLPIDIYWTTNYDSLIEDTLKSNRKKVDIKVSQDQLKYFRTKRDAVVYKMHGDKDHPDDAVITRDDYEAYDKTRSLFTINLKGQLIEKTFLFIGFSFEDPNLEQILSRIRVELMGKSPKNHYCFFKKVNKEQYKNKDGTYNEEKFSYDTLKQQLKIKDLERYGINTILVEEYEDVTKLLRSVFRKYKASRIFISGSAEEYGYIGRDNSISLMHNLSKRLIKEEYHIISGFGLGVGSYIINGALDEIYSNKNKHTDKYLTLRPFPQYPSGNKSLKELWTEYRKDMISSSGICIFMFGNKKDKDAKIIHADGVVEEFNIAKEQVKFIIPISITGYSSEDIMRDIKKNLDEYWYLKDSIEVLEKEIDLDKIINEVFKILNKIRSGK